MVRGSGARWAFVGLAATLLSGCAGLRPSGDGPDLPSITRGDQVIVYMRWPGDDPYPTADKVCRGLGAWPEPRTFTPSNASFNCVKTTSPPAAAPGRP